MILVVELPTPRVIKKKVRKYLTKERACMYGLIIGGCIVVYTSHMPVKVIPISALLYCGVAYEVISRYDDIIEDKELLADIIRHYDNYQGF